MLYVAQGTVRSVGPHHSGALVVDVRLCTAVAPVSSPEEASPSLPTCTPLAADALRVLPHPRPGAPFPLPNEGVDEGEGVVLFSARLPPAIEGVDSAQRWVVVDVLHADGQGWAAGGFVEQPVVGAEAASDISVHGALCYLAMLCAPVRPPLTTTIMTTARARRANVQGRRDRARCRWTRARAHRARAAAAPGERARRVSLDARVRPGRGWVMRWCASNYSLPPFSQYLARSNPLALLFSSTQTFSSRPFLNSPPPSSPTFTRSTRINASRSCCMRTPARRSSRRARGGSV